jgi:hypothetical protein
MVLGAKMRFYVQKAGSLAAERNEAGKPVKADNTITYTIFSSNIHNLRKVKKAGIILK